MGEIIRRIVRVPKDGVIRIAANGVAPGTPVEIVIAEDRSVTIREKDKAGRVIGEKPVARGEIAKLITDPKTPVLIAGDKNVKYEAVLQLMDELRAQGIERVGLQVRPSVKPAQ